jgi:hypothetical protein
MPQYLFIALKISTCLVGNIGISIDRCFLLKKLITIYLNKRFDRDNYRYNILQCDFVSVDLFISASSK